MAYATFEHDGRRRIGRVDGERLVPLAGLTELGRHTDVDALRGGPPSCPARPSRWTACGSARSSRTPTRSSAWG